MKILKYQKKKNNQYKIVMDQKELCLYEEIITKYRLLLKKEISEKELEELEKENNLLKAYYEGVKILNKKLKTKKEIDSDLKKQGFKKEERDYALNLLEERKFLDTRKYLEAFIHDKINLSVVGEAVIEKELIDKGLEVGAIREALREVDRDIYQEKIKKYIEKKAKGFKGSQKAFKDKMTKELVNKGFLKEDILEKLDKTIILEDENVIKNLVSKLQNKYGKKEKDTRIVKMKIKNYLYQKGYQDIDIEQYIEKE